MNLDKLTWYAARSGGIVAWALLAAGLILGLLLSSRVLGRRASPAWILSIHRFLGGLSVVFTAVHVVAIMLDDFVVFGLMDVLVPWASEWKPSAVAWGVIAMYLMVAIELTSFAMKRLPRSVWRAVHWSSAPLFIVATMHGWQAGTDAGRAFMGAIVATTVVLAGLTVVRVVMARRRPDARDPRALLDEAKARRDERRRNEVTVDHGTPALLAEAALASDQGNAAMTGSWLPGPEPEAADASPAPVGWFSDNQGGGQEPADDIEEEPVFGSFFATAPDAPPAELDIEAAPLPAPARSIAAGSAATSSQDGDVDQRPPAHPQRAHAQAEPARVDPAPAFGQPPARPTPAPPTAQPAALTPEALGPQLAAAPARPRPDTASPSPALRQAPQLTPARPGPETTSRPTPAFAQTRPPVAAAPQPPTNPWADQPPTNAAAGAAASEVTTAAPTPGWLEGVDDAANPSPKPSLHPVSERREGPVPGVWKRTLDSADR